MSRLPPLELPGVPRRVTQRGINLRRAIVLDADNRYHFRHLLRTVFRDHGMALWVTPDAIGARSLAMDWIGQCYVQAVNLRHRRCGALWQGRFKPLSGIARTQSADRHAPH